MNIRHECPLPDLSFAVSAPLNVRTATGQILTVDRWSLEGIFVDAQGETLSDVFLTIPFQGVEVAFPVKLAPSEADNKFVFVDLTVRQRETLAIFYKGLLSGQMVATSDIITSLDTPVDLVPMGETEQEKALGLAKAKPRFFRIVWNLFFYALLALFLVGFVGSNIWQRLSQVPLDHGRFVASVQSYAAPDIGYVERLNVQVGEKVKKGDIIARLEDPDRQSDVEEVRNDILIADRRLQSAMAQRDRHIANRTHFRQPLWDAFYTLWHPFRPQEPRTPFYTGALQNAWYALQRFDAGEDQTSNGYHTTLADLNGAVEDRNLELRRWKRELRHRKSAANELVVRAKENGTVYAVHIRKGEFVGRGDLIADIEEDTPRTAVGWLDDKLATTAYVGMPATVRYSFRGRSKIIDGTVIDLQASTNATEPGKYGMVVTIKADGAGLLKTRKWFRPNAPARIDLKRDPLRLFWQEEEDAGT